MDPEDEKNRRVTKTEKRAYAKERHDQKKIIRFDSAVEVRMTNELQQTRQTAETNVNNFVFAEEDNW